MQKENFFAVFNYRSLPFLMTALSFAGFALLLCFSDKRYVIALFVATAWAVQLFFYQKGCKKFRLEIQRVIDRATGGEKTDDLSKDPLILAFEEYLLAALDKAYRSDYKEEAFDRRLELSALQGQINPHFLYNTLDSIRGEAILCGNMSVAEMTEALAMIFRYSISTKGNIVTIADELRNIKYYLLIQKFRFDDRFQYEIECEDEGVTSYCIPKLTIQPFVENALFHGLEHRRSGGLLHIKITSTDQRIEIRIEDNGKGIAPETLKRVREALNSRNPIPNQEERGNGIAMVNVNKRIQLAFGSEYGINVYSELGYGTIIEVSLPKKKNVGTEIQPA